METGAVAVGLAVVSVQAVAEALRSDYLTTGPRVAEFEERFAEVHVVHQRRQHHIRRHTEVLRAVAVHAVELVDRELECAVAFAAREERQEPRRAGDGVRRAREGTGYIDQPARRAS